MNPLEFRGPEFLLFYGVLATAIIMAVWWLNRQLGSDLTPGEVDITDPYEIAYLRGGRNEVIRVAVVKLVQSKILRVVDSKTVVIDDPAGGRALSNPLEREIAKLFSSPMEPHKAFAQMQIRDQTNTYERRLVRKGLLLDDEMTSSRTRRAWVAALVLWGLAGAKILIGMSRNRPVSFLVGMLVISTCALLIVSFTRRRTVHGDNAVEGIRQVFAYQREMQPDAGVAQVALVAAVFGLAAIPLEAFPERKGLFPRANGDGSSCGSSCGSSGCGSGGGGGCGGGGCGGCGS
ncbi:MAG: TIGR04222 domain-containing membrane protein [Bryobacteraceae bacterium]